MQTILTNFLMIKRLKIVKTQTINPSFLETSVQTLTNFSLGFSQDKKKVFYWTQWKKNELQEHVFNSRNIIFFMYNFGTYTVYYLKDARQGCKDHRNYLQIILHFRLWKTQALMTSRFIITSSLEKQENKNYLRRGRKTHNDILNVFCWTLVVFFHRQMPTGKRKMLITS